MKKLGLFTVIAGLVASGAVACAAPQSSVRVLTNGNGDYVAGVVTPDETAVMLAHDDQRYVVHVPGGQWRLGSYDAREGQVGGSSHAMLGTGYENPERDYMALIIDVGAKPGGSWDAECRSNAWSLKNDTTCLRTRLDDTLYTVTRHIPTGYMNIVAYGEARDMIAIVDAIEYYAY